MLCTELFRVPEVRPSSDAELNSNLDRPKLTKVRLLIQTPNLIVEFRIPGYPGPSKEQGTDVRLMRGKITLSRQNTNVVAALCCLQIRF